MKDLISLFFPPQASAWRAINWAVYVGLLAIGFAGLQIVGRSCGTAARIWILGH